jgi:hypothetical protein
MGADSIIPVSILLDRYDIHVRCEYSLNEEPQILMYLWIFTDIRGFILIKLIIGKKIGFF